MKIGVYAIARNEGAHVREWLAACGEADAICVTDTGSTDHTPDQLRSGGATVTCWARPFRFDRARIYALESAKAYAPEVEIWASLDLDEYPEAGWRDKLEAAIAADPTAQGWRITIDNGGYSFQNIRVHRADGWTWQHACHEVLNGPGPIRDAGFKVVHHQDASKIRDYLPLLELDATENPTDARAWHYLGREYMYQQRWQEAIDALNKAVEYDAWDEQRAASYRFISRCKWRLRQYGGAKEASYKAAQVYPGREEWVDLAWLLDWLRDPAAKEAAKKAMEVTTPGLYPAEGSAWGPLAESIYKKWAEA